MTLPFFINGVFEGLHNFVYSKFDCAIFSTSLDHFPDLDAVKNQIRNIIKPRGLAIFLVGLHDPEIVAEQTMGEYWQGFPILSLKRVLKRSIGFPLSILRVHRWMKKRQEILSKGQALDSLHFHYFTAASIHQYMSSVGKIIDYQKIEQTNGVFYAIQIPED